MSFKNVIFLFVTVFSLLVSFNIAYADNANNSKSLLGAIYTLDNYSIPAKTQASEYQPLPVKREISSNGVTVLVQESPFDNIVAVETLIRCGSAEEESNSQGFTNMIMDILSQRLTTDDNGDDIVEITGSVVEAGVLPDFARISIVTTPQYLGQMTDRLTNTLSKGDFTQKEVDKSRKRLLTILQAGGGAYTQIYEIFLQNFYRFHPYKRSVQGNEAIFKRVTPLELNEFYSQHFTANNIVVAVAGKVNPLEIVTKVSKGLSTLKNKSNNKVEIQWEPKSIEKEIYLSSASNLAWVFIGYPAPEVLSVDYSAVKCAYCALGEGLSSRLWVELRENRGLAYEVAARYPDLMGPSHMLAYIVTKPGSTGEARRRILAEVEKLRKTPIPQKELDECKRKLFGNFLLARETNSGKALNLAVAELSGEGYEADSRYLNDLEKVTAEDVRKAAEKYFVKPTIIVARPGGRFYFDW